MSLNSREMRVWRFRPQAIIRRPLFLIAVIIKVIVAYLMFLKSSPEPKLPGYVKLHTNEQFRALNQLKIDHEQLCQLDKFKHASFLIIVKSSSTNRDHRDAIRQTWISDADKLNIPYLFLTGLTNHTLTEDLQMEARMRRDVIVGNFNDHYYNLTLKTVTALRWQLRNCVSKFLLYVDDDVAVNVNNVIEYVKQVNASAPIMYCNIADSYDAGVNRWPSRWFVPKSIYPNENYPDFCRGMAVLYTPFAAGLLNSTVSDEHFQPKLWVDDALINGIVAQRANVQRVHDGRFVLKYPLKALFKENLVIGQIGRGDNFTANYEKVKRNTDSDTPCWITKLWRRFLGEL